LNKEKKNKGRMQEVMDALSNAKTRKKAPVKKGKKAVAPPYESKNKDKKQLNKNALNVENKKEKTKNKVAKPNKNSVAQGERKTAKTPTVKTVAPANTGKKKGKKPSVKIIFLGGVGEVGKNMTAIECGEDIIVIDAGVMFPSENMPGIDLVVPDVSYLIENKHKIRAVLLTHGHEDHIGGVPYLLKEINATLVGTKLTLALVDNKLREHKINDYKHVVVAPNDTLSLG